MSSPGWAIRAVFPVMAAGIALSAVVTGTGAYLAARQADEARENVRAIASARNDVDRIAFLIERVQLSNVLAGYVPAAAAQTGPAITTDLNAIGRATAHAKSLPLSDAQHAAVDAIGTSFNRFLTWLPTVKPPRTAAQTQRVAARYAGYVGAVDRATAAAQGRLSTGLAAEQDALRGAVHFSLALVIGLCALTAVLAGGAILLIGRQITRRLAGVQSGLQALAAGDLRARVPAGGARELAEIGAHVNQVAERLGTVFSSLAATGNRLGEAAARLQSVATDVGRSAGETSAQADVVARTAGEVSMNVQSVAGGGEEMNASISEIGRNAQEAARVATGAVQAVESTTVTMSKLGDSSREIGDVIRLITSIAEQTNLLALNATIEAARAGDAGKGFAVVADEVKQLAQETARATEDISRRVETIQLDADQAAAAIQDIAGVITRINEFQTIIAAAVEEQTATTQAINAGVSEAATGSGQIAHSIAGVAASAGATTTSMEKTNDSARELATMSTELTALLSDFRV